MNPHDMSVVELDTKTVKQQNGSSKLKKGKKNNKTKPRSTTNRVDRVSGNTTFFFWPKGNENVYSSLMKT